MSKKFTWTVVKDYQGAMFFGDLPNRKNGKKGIWMSAGKDQIINLHEYFTLEELESSIALKQALTKQTREDNPKLTTLEKFVYEDPDQEESQRTSNNDEMAELKSQISSMTDMLKQMQEIMSKNQQPQVIYTEPPPQTHIQQENPDQSMLLNQILTLVRANTPKTLTGYSELNSDEIAIKLLGEHASDRTSNFSEIGKEENINTNASDVARELDNIDLNIDDEDV